ncbi:MAG: trypsin-like peptidase domain-containing protein [Planctomycetota bacterium]
MFLRTAHAATLFAVASVSCVTVDPEPEVSPDAPVELVAPPVRLAGVDLGQLVATASETVATGPLDTQAIERVARLARPAVVSLYLERDVQASVRLLPIAIPGLGIPVTLPGTALGSGFVIHPAGYAITNNHVVRGASRIRAMTSEGVALGAEVLARDPVYDLALLRLFGAPGPFPVLPMGDSDLAAVGSFAIAVGNPLGLGHTVSFGIVSQTGRHLMGVPPEEGREIDFIQMDTPINPGSSGGPLVTLTGAWIGVNTATFDGAQNIGFAVPSRQVVEFLQEAASLAASNPPSAPSP